MSFTFETKESELLIDAPIIAVRRDTVTMPGGGTAKREIMEHFGAVAVVAERDGKIAMVRQYRHTVGKRLLELPAGILDIANEPALTCAERELVEEAGLKAGKWSVLTDLLTSPGVCDESVRVFLAQDLEEVERPEAEDEEADLTLEWVELKDAVQHILSGGIINSIAIAGVFAANEVLNHGGTARSVDAPFDARPTALATRRIAQGYQPDMKKR